MAPVRLQRTAAIQAADYCSVCPLPTYFVEKLDDVDLWTEILAAGLTRTAAIERS
jgi:hypothetical protein